MKLLSPFRMAMFLAVVVCVSGLAEVPRTLAFQGRATNAAGAPLNGDFDLTFRIYDQESGGLALWTEIHPDVDIMRGVFAVPLGVTTPLSLPFDRQYWVSIQVELNAEMTPRIPLTSSPYALRAAIADALAPGALPLLAVPSGGIIMWSGSIAKVPAGWRLCDGSNGTPDLRDRFVVGARADLNGKPASNLEGTLNSSGGSTTQPPITTNSGDNGAAASGPNAVVGNHAHYFVPPYFALAFIMKQ